MDDTNSLIEQRKAKLAALRAKGIDPFKNKFTPTEACAAARLNYAEGREVALAGRITAHRDMGKSMFIDLRDQSGRIQAYAQVMLDHTARLLSEWKPGEVRDINRDMMRLTLSIVAKTYSMPISKRNPTAWATR